ncbi:MAG: hypothetical protein NUW37_02545 [Planctomycetes bacterium]|nr:hypothetical protein [Planctomycetota bacterium]
MDDPVKYSRKPNEDMFELTVIGPGFGESCVLHVPGAGWGVIDCCKGTTDYLHSQGVENLSFAALTHPHLDHYEGFNALFDLYTGRIERIWLYDGYIEQRLIRLLDVAQKNAIFNARKLFNVLEMFAGEIKKGAKGRKIAAGTNLLSKKYQMDGGKSFEIAIDGLGPSLADINRFVGLLRSRPNDIDGDLSHACALFSLMSPEMNLVSATIRVRIGTMNIIFGGDTLIGQTNGEGWREIALGTDSTDIECDVIKVSHHGSKTSFCAEAWKRHKGEKAKVPFAIVTRFSKSKVPLPDESETKALKNCAHTLLTPSIGNPRKLSKVIGTNAEKALKRLGRKVHSVEKNKLGIVRIRIPLSTMIPNLELFGSASEVL